MPSIFSLCGGSLKHLVTRQAWVASFLKWLEDLRSNAYHRSGAEPSIANVWCFKWDQTRLIYDLGYKREFDYPGIYLFLADEGTPEAYTPIYMRNTAT